MAIGMPAASELAKSGANGVDAGLPVKAQRLQSPRARGVGGGWGRDGRPSGAPRGGPGGGGTGGGGGGGGRALGPGAALPRGASDCSRRRASGGGRVGRRSGRAAAACAVGAGP